MKRFLIFILAALTLAFDASAQVSLREATAAEVAAGTAGLPGVVTARRMANAVTTNTLMIDASHMTSGTVYTNSANSNLVVNVSIGLTAGSQARIYIDQGNTGTYSTAAITEDAGGGTQQLIAYIKPGSRYYITNTIGTITVNNFTQRIYTPTTSRIAGGGGGGGTTYTNNGTLGAGVISGSGIGTNLTAAQLASANVVTNWSLRNWPFDTKTHIIFGGNSISYWAVTNSTLPSPATNSTWGYPAWLRYQYLTNNPNVNSYDSLVAGGVGVFNGGVQSFWGQLTNNIGYWVNQYTNSGSNYYNNRILWAFVGTGNDFDNGNYTVAQEISGFSNMIVTARQPGQVLMLATMNKSFSKTTTVNGLTYDQWRGQVNDWLRTNITTRPAYLMDVDKAFPTWPTDMLVDGLDHPGASLNNLIAKLFLNTVAQPTNSDFLPPYPQIPIGATASFYMAYQTNDQTSAASSTVYTNSTDLFVTLPAGVWQGFVYAQFDGGGSGGGSKSQLNFSPNSIGGLMSIAGNTSSSFLTSAVNWHSGWPSSGPSLFYHSESTQYGGGAANFFLRTTTNTTVRVQFTQNSSAAGGCTIKANSTLNIWGKANP